MRDSLLVYGAASDADCFMEDATGSDCFMEDARLFWGFMGNTCVITLEENKMFSSLAIYMSVR